MTSVELIVEALNKANKPDHKSTVSPREKCFIEHFKASPYFEKLTVEKTLDKKEILMWRSGIGEIVACIITNKKIDFTGVEIYEEQEDNLVCTLDLRFPGDKEKATILDKEIEEIKALLLIYSEEAITCFK